MRILYLTAAAAAALAVGLASAHAQRMEPRGDERPAAESAQQPQRGKETNRSRRGASEQRSNKSWDQQAAEKAAQDGQRGTTGQAQDQTDRPAASGTATSPQRATETDRTRSSAGERSRSNADRDGSRERSRDARDQRRGQDARERSRSSSEGAGRDDSRGTGQARQQRDGSDTTREGARSTQQQQQQQQQQQERTATQDRSRGGGLQLSEQQRSRITTTFSERIDRLNVRPLSRTNISVSIGATIPRSVRVYDVPTDIVRIYPRFRGHKFVVVEDEIVVIAPDRRRIVATLPMSGERQAARASTRTTTGTAPARDPIRLTPQEQTVVRTTILREPACRFEQRLDFFIGIPLPRTVRVCEFPDEVLAEVPEFRRYRYITRDDEIVVVDPDGYRVVDVIR
jgi:hypothetical protein